MLFEYGYKQGLEKGKEVQLRDIISYLKEQEAKEVYYDGDGEFMFKNMIYDLETEFNHSSHYK